MIILYILFILILLILIWHITTKKYINSSKLYFYFGKKGVGKSTLIAKGAYENLKKGKTVYTQELLTFPIKDKIFSKKKYISTIPFDPSNIYSYSFPIGSVIYIDEASLLWSNRDVFTSKNKDKMKPIIEWFQQQRKYQVSVHMFSVSFDIDKKIRDLCDEMYLVRKYMRVLTIAQHVVRKPVIVHPQGDSPASIQDDIIEDGLILAPFGGIKLCFIPKWSKYFDTYRIVVDSTKPTPPLSSLKDLDLLDNVTTVSQEH